MKVEIADVQNGYIIFVKDGIKRNGTYIFRNVDVLKMLEFIGEVVLDRKVGVEER
jgi:hypothetical protein